MVFFLQVSPSRFFTPFCSPLYLCVIWAIHLGERVYSLTTGCLTKSISLHTDICYLIKYCQAYIDPEVRKFVRKTNLDHILKLFKFHPLITLSSQFHFNIIFPSTKRSLPLRHFQLKFVCTVITVDKFHHKLSNQLLFYMHSYFHLSQVKIFFSALLSHYERA